MARKLLKQPRPFAILLPIDLLHCIYDPVGGGLDQEDRVARARPRDAHKLIFSSDNLVWVLGNWPGSTTEVFAIEFSQASGGEELCRRRQEHDGIFYGVFDPCRRKESFVTLYSGKVTL